MGDKAFEWSLTAITILVLVWIGTGIGLLFLPILFVTFCAIVVEVLAGIVLIYFWGKDYMGRRL